MRNLIIVGAGGFAKELFGYIRQDISLGYLENIRVKGFLDVSEESYNQMKIDSVYLGSEINYLLEEDDVFLIAIGDVRLREKIVDNLENMKVNFFTYIHSSVFIDDTADIGRGVIICPFSMVNAQSKIGDYTLMNIHTSVAHDSIVGKNSVLSPYCTLNGNVQTGKNFFMGTRATVLPNVIVGNNCVIAAGTVVSKAMEDKAMAYYKLRASYVIKK